MMPCKKIIDTEEVSILYFNSNSISNKLFAIKSYVNTYNPAIICITETKIDNDFDDNELLGPEFTVYRKDLNKNGGGVLIAISNKCKHINVLKSTKGTKETVTASIQIANVPLNITTHYRPPSEPDVIGLDELFNQDHSKYPSIYMGDFNLPDIDRKINPKGQVKPYSPRKIVHSQALDIIEAYNLTQLIHQSTHNRGNTLDLVLVENSLLDDIIIKCEVLPPISDHNMILTTIKCQKSNGNCHSKYTKAKLNLNNAEYRPINASFEKLLDTFKANKTFTAEQLWSSFLLKIQEVTDQYVPTIPPKPKGKPWINRDLIRVIRRRDRLHNRNKKYPTSENIKEEQEVSKRVKQLIAKSKSEFINNHISRELEAGNTKPLYNLVKKSKGQTNQINSLAGTASDQIANELGKFFSSVYAKNSNNIPHFNPKPTSKMGGITVDTEGVKKLLTSLDKRKSCGPDNLSAYLLNSFAKNVPTFAECIAHIFQRCLDFHEVPQVWKEAIICPIFKSGNREEANNYRPISLTCILSKTLEHIIASAMWQHIDENEIVTNKQHGFRERLNTTTQLLHVAHNALRALNDKKEHHMVSFDFSKAFDKVPHNLLIYKLERLGFSKQTVNWIREWLESRTSKVSVNGQTSHVFKTTSGVPQGSVLGPLLFTLYINDIPDKIANSDCRLYADDTLLCYTCNDNNTLLPLQDDIDHLSEWSKQWCMPFNPSKCVHIVIGKESSALKLRLSNQDIPTSDKLKYLGVMFQSNLKWDTHTKITCKKANKSFGMLRRCLDGAPHKVKNIAFNTIAKPILEYATPVWSPHTKTLINELDRIHRRALRWIFNIPKAESLSDIMKLKQIDTLEDRRAEQDTKFLRKIEFGLYDVKLENYITQNNCHDTRHKLVNSQYSINQFKHSFFCRMGKQVKILFNTENNPLGASS